MAIRYNDLRAMKRIVGLILLVVLPWWTGLTLVMSAAHGAASGNPENGKENYLRFCFPCHGENGRGDGPRAPFLAPKPGNLVSAATSVKSDEELLTIIEKGQPRTAMKGWKDTLSEQERLDVLAYIRSLIRFQPDSLTPPPPDSSP